MGGTKIIVVQLKEIIKSVIFAIIGLLLIVLLVYFFLPRESESEQSTSIYESIYEPGTYFSDLILKDSSINIAVTVTEDEIVSIELENITESQEFFYPLVKPVLMEISEEVMAAQTTDIHISDEYAITGQALLFAINSALAQATPLS